MCELNDQTCYCCGEALEAKQIAVKYPLGRLAGIAFCRERGLSIHTQVAICDGCMRIVRDGKSISDRTIKTRV